MMARMDRLDLLLGYLEEMTQQQHGLRRSTATSSPSTPATGGGGGLISDDDSSAASTPRGGSKTWRRAASSCRPAKEALEEAQAKGTLVERIALLEDRVLKMEEDMLDQITPEKVITMSSYGGHDDDASSKEKPLQDRYRSSKNNKKKGLKSLVKSCVRGSLKTED
ncbi:hypothetical protein BAE44_0013323 [Dichanthelium oligosanthes]|uniref:Uncharacterized protein n=1 Tax=Dichanthelium oligosanthes TaxID=888268 RepID=A0A1E5VKK9_9POAL|nr:hypothetical protein BAE44_0013323 [Dichanthelium oligosanthes]